MISLIVPSYGRPERLKVMLDSACDTAIDLPDYRVMVEKFDPRLADYGDDVDAGNYGSSSQAWLAGFRTAHDFGHLSCFHMAADDLVYMTPGWDQTVLAAMPRGKAWVIQHRDNFRDDKQFCTPFMSREFLELCNFMPWHPGLKHFYTDTWIEDVARRAECWTYLPDVLIEQRHYKNHLAPRDATYDRPRDGPTWAHDDQLFNQYLSVIDRESFARKIKEFNK